MKIARDAITKTQIMATKIRLQRHGRKRRAFYHIVVADSRAKRNGKLIERIGSYDPNSNPATINLDLDKSVKWLQTGAQPTDTCKAILSYKGAIYKNHLLNGVRKGALTEEQVEAKFSKWLEEKEARIQAKKDGLLKASNDDKASRLKAENEVRLKKEAAQAAKMAPPAEETPAAEAAPEAPEAPAAEEKTAE